MAENRPILSEFNAYGVLHEICRIICFTMGKAQNTLSQDFGLFNPSAPAEYSPRNPEKSLLFQIIRNHWKTFELMMDQYGSGLPRFVRDEFESFLGCGVIQYGFIRLKCDSCKHEKLIGFSCKKRGFCGSCIGRRMAETAANLNDFVLPYIPYRQWVISFPIPLRFLLAKRPEVLDAILRVYISEVSRIIRRRARAEGKCFDIPLDRFQTGAYTAIQRFGQSLALNIHYHSIFFDGAYLLPETVDDKPVFFGIKSLSNEDLAEVLLKIVKKVKGYLTHEGFLTADGELISDSGSDDQSEDVLAQLQLASVQNQVATGERSGKRVRLIKNDLLLSDVQIESPRCVQVLGFSLHANVEVESEKRDQLEKLIRYFTRPPVAEKRLHLLENGDLFYEFKSSWRDGTIGVKFTPLEFIEKLSAMVPLPRRHLFRYHGLLAPNSEFRSQILPIADSHDKDEEKAAAILPKKPLRISWADLLKRVFQIDLAQCPDCGGELKFIAAIMKKSVIAKILEHLKLSTDPPRFKPAESPS